MYYIFSINSLEKAGTSMPSKVPEDIMSRAMPTLEIGDLRFEIVDFKASCRASEEVKTVTLSVPKASRTSSAVMVCSFLCSMTLGLK